MKNGNGNGWAKYLTVLGTAASLVVASVFIYRAMTGSAVATALNCQKLITHDSLIVDLGKRTRDIEDAYKEMRPVVRAVARRLNVELDSDSTPRNRRWIDDH
jgi:hypothetical protein